MEVSTAIVD